VASMGRDFEIQLVSKRFNQCRMELSLLSYIRARIPNCVLIRPAAEFKCWLLLPLVNLDTSMAGNKTRISSVLKLFFPLLLYDLWDS
jgi:hypothetical protein